MSTPHACTEPDGPVCVTCHADDGAKGRQPRTFVLAEDYPTARQWCRENGVRLFARSTVIATRGAVLRGYRLRPEDRVEVLGSGPAPEVLRDLDIARQQGAHL